ncbi:unnamed protein product [marine sediment metagenome]|uniref:Polysaccharide pyruvyl transferase domain-containing protein n=1 Tax=marine sediment metagenome TaxID=412755 RepID=X1S0S3_9ZZZZ
MGPFRNKFFNIIRRKILNKVEIITVRDSESLKYILKLNLSKPLVYLTADSAFNNEINSKNSFYCELINKFYFFCSIF